MAKHDGKIRLATKRRSPATSSPIAATSTMVSDMNRSGKKKRSRVDNPQELVTAEESESDQQQQWSKSKKKRMRVRLIKERQQMEPVPVTDAITTDAMKGRPQLPVLNTENVSTWQHEKKSKVTVNVTASVHGISGSNGAKVGSLSALQKAFQERLTGSRFRILNEELYTSTSTTAFQRFQQNPSLFDEYHEGFRHQVGLWPINPVTIIVEQLTQLYLASLRNVSSKRKFKKIVVADFGCGEAELAKQLLMIRDSSKNTCPFVVHSFDLVAKGPNAELITACDAAHTPLAAGTVDYGIFCLALMGTNLADFIREGHRVLKPDGRLFIAEVRSRFESATLSNTEPKTDNSKKEAKGNEASLQEFIHVLDQLGFEAYHTDRSNTMFVLLNLKKNGKKPRKDLKYTAKACIYKRR